MSVNQHGGQSTWNSTMAVGQNLFVDMLDIVFYVVLGIKKGDSM